MTKAARLTVILIFVVMFFFSGCAEKETSGISDMHKELKIGTGWDATRPGDYQPYGMWEPACLIYETLVNLDKDCRPIPCLADKWDISKNSLVYTFYLCKGIKFHDKTPFNANAVKINFVKLGRINWHALSKVVKSVEVVNDHTVQFVLSRPAPLFFIHLAGSGCGIIAPSCIKAKTMTEKSSFVKTGTMKAEKEIKIMPPKKMTMPAGNMRIKNAVQKKIKSYVVAGAVGTGPYMWDETAYQRSRSFSIVRNNGYRQGTPVFERITWLVIPDPGARTIALESGEIGMTGQSPNASLFEENIMTLKQNDKIRLVKSNNWGTRLVLVNHKRPPFDNINVRRALRLAIDYVSLQKVFNELAVVCPGPFGPDAPFTNPDIKLPQYDPEKARDILDQEKLFDSDGDGFREYNGKNIEIGITISKSTAMGVLLCEYFKNIGLKAGLNQKESGAIFQILGQMAYDIAVHPNIPSFYLDMYDAFHSSGRWSIHMNSLKIDTLLDQYTVCSDHEKFKNLSYLIEKEIQKQEIILFAINESKLAAYQKNLGAFIYPPEEWVGAVQEIWKMK